MSDPERLEIVEVDEAGDVVSTYIASGKSRVDVVRPKETKTYAQQVLDIFLPAGYPHSVTEDYMQYQIYDSLQAFSSSIAGLLASRAVLQGVGVGDSTASPTSALLLSILQDSTGRLATILFAHRLGSALEPECKTYRLAADIFNDTAMVLDCLSPGFPKPARVMLLSMSSCLRALCGVCAGSAKASLSAHFARRGNLGELNAKDASQETVISLLGMLAGSLVVSFVTTPLATWSTLVLLLSVHLGMNYAAVKAVSMTSLNRQRANIVLSGLVDQRVSRVLSPREVSRRERVFERDGVVRWYDGKGDDTTILGYCRIGVSMQTLLGRINRTPRTGSGAFDKLSVNVADLLHVFASEGYVLWHHDNSLEDITANEVVIVLKKDCTTLDQLKAWMHAILVLRSRHDMGSKASLLKAGDEYGKPRLNELKATLAKTQHLFTQYEAALESTGWDLSIAALETRAGFRAAIHRNKEPLAH